MKMTVEEIEKNIDVFADYLKQYNKCIVDVDFYNQMKAESLELSKKKILQEAKPIHHHIWGTTVYYTCPECDVCITKQVNYCSHCGTALKFKSRSDNNEKKKK